MSGRILLDGRPYAFAAGESVATVIVRHGEHPTGGGCLCLAGDCGNCVAVVDGTAFVRTCQVAARPAMVVWRHPRNGPSMFTSVVGGGPSVEHSHADVVVIGAGDSGVAAAVEAHDAGRTVRMFDASQGEEVVGIYAGPTVIVRTDANMLHVRAHDVVVATGAAELVPVCDGSSLAGIFTPAAALSLQNSGVRLGRVVAVGSVSADLLCTPVAGELVRFHGDRRVRAVVTSVGGVETAHPCDSAVVSLGWSARDILSRMATGGRVRVVGPAAASHELPPCPAAGVVCPCSKVGVDDLQAVWDKGFRELELVKRASLAGTGTCQGSACLPRVRAFLTDRHGVAPEPFTARAAARQLTMGEAGAGYWPPPFRRTPLHHEHLRLGANMDRFGGWWRPWNYGDHVAEYWAVREAVSLGDVSTLGKMIVQGPDAVELLERLYPTTIADIRPGRSRYVLLLNERGHVIDDGMVCREDGMNEDTGDDTTRFVLTFTSGGAGNAEMWIRDWIDTWGLDVLVLDRTMSLGAINVTGPFAGELLRRVGLSDPVGFLRHGHHTVAGVACHVMRLSFTGEASYELHHSIRDSVQLWRELMDAGRSLGIRPHGLQALFGLRLEKGHVIVGQDTELDTTPRRIGMDWAVKMEKPDFLGKEALLRTALLPDSRRLIGLTMDGPAPTEGSPIWIGADIVGHVSSSFASPLLGRTVMLGWLKRNWSPGGPPIHEVVVDNRAATIVNPPFYDPDGARARA